MFVFFLAKSFYVVFGCTWSTNKIIKLLILDLIVIKVIVTRCNLNCK